MSDNQSMDLNELKKDARWAIWSFILINMIVVFFFIVDGIYNPFVFVGLLVQGVLILFWILPMFLYQVLFKGINPKYAFYKALASYKDIMGHVSWP